MGLEYRTVITGKTLSLVWSGLVVVLLSTTGCADLFPPTKAAIAQQAMVAQVNRNDLKTADMAQRLERLEAGLKDLRQQNSAQDAAYKELRQQHGALEAAYKELRQQHTVLESAQNASTSQTSLRLTKVEAAQREATGAFEEASHAGIQVNQRIDRLSTDFGFRLDRLDKQVAGISTAMDAAAATAAASSAAAAAAAPAGTGAGAGAGAGTGAPSSLAAAVTVGAPKSAVRKSDQAAKPETLSPAKAFAQAMEAYSRGKLDRAQSLFESFIDENPRNENLPEAIFTLGRVYFDGRQFGNASIQFLNIYEKYPRSAFAAESVYRLGLTLQRLEKTEQACQAFSRVPLDYPKADREILSKAAAAYDRYKCR